MRNEPDATDADDAAGRPHLVLVGMMGCGKSSVGRRVARALGRPFVDLDTAIERTARCRIPELFEREGEAGFRERESAELTAVLATPEPAVVATGGGAVLRAENRDAMRRRAVVVWLRARPDTLLARVGDGTGRPLLAGDPLGNLTRLAAERAGAYRDAAHEIIDVDGLPFDVITARVQRVAGVEVAR
jgi:shikimate kinase